MKKLFIMIVLFISLFVGININKVSAYKCVYKGERVDAKTWFDAFDGDMEIELGNGVPAAINWEDFNWQRAKNLIPIANLIGHSTPISPLEYLSFPIKIDGNGKNVKPGAPSELYEDVAKQLSQGKFCPSEINISRGLCYNASALNDPLGMFKYTGSIRFGIFYHFNADIWDYFILDDNNKGQYYYYIPSESLDLMAPASSTLKNWLTRFAYNGSKWDICMYESKEKNVSQVWSLDEKKSEGKPKRLMFTCNKLESDLKTKKDSLTNLYNTYSSCIDKNKNNKSVCTKHKSKYEKTLLKVRTWCKSVLDTRQYNSGCLQGCVQLNKKLYNIKCIRTKKKNGKNVEYDVCANKAGTCNLTDDMIAFIYNILKWVRYIAPVLVIVLGILDFIKALVAQDDDAMKKAQGKFIKRLIAAVLLFLLPLIIDYILNVFGLYDKNCDVTDLFK